MKKIVIYIFLIIFSVTLSYADEPTEYIEYYPNGKIKLKGPYIDNKKIGIWTLYREDGSKKTEFSYIDSDNYFAVNSYNKTGVLKSTGFVKEMKQDGEWLFYDENGALLLRLNFKSGLKEDLFIAYSKDGVPIVVGVFKNDTLYDIKSIK